MLNARFCPIKLLKSAIENSRVFTAIGRDVVHTCQALSTLKKPLKWEKEAFKEDSSLQTTFFQVACSSGKV